MHIEDWHSEHPDGSGGYALLIGSCIRCHAPTIGDPDTMPSFVVNLDTRCPLNPDGTHATLGQPHVSREPACPACTAYHKANIGKPVPWPYARIDLIRRPTEGDTPAMTENAKDRVTDLRDWNEGGWTWTVEHAEINGETRFRTNRDFEGLFVWIEDGPSTEWRQILGHLQVSWPKDRAKMINKLAQPVPKVRPGYDVSALTPPATRDAPGRPVGTPPPYEPVSAPAQPADAGAEG